MSEPAPPHPFDCTAFIGELRTLREQAAQLSEKDEGQDAPLFRRWRHDLQDLITRIQPNHGRELPGGVKRFGDPLR